jgi:hypothetical protein
MCPNLANKKIPPKFVIANSFVIGSFPREIEFANKDGKRNIRNIKDNELTDLLKSMLAPVRPYGCVFSYSGWSQKSITGIFFFEMDQNKLRVVINHLNQAGIGEQIYCDLCGRRLLKANSAQESCSWHTVVHWHFNMVCERIWPPGFPEHYRSRRMS